MSDETTAKRDDPYRAVISLRIWHPNISPRELMAPLGLSADVSQEAGEPRVAPNGERLAGLYKQTYCVFRLSPQSFSEVEMCIASSLERLRPHKAVLNKVIVDGGRCELFIGLFLHRVNAGIELRPQLLAMASDLGLSLSFDVYGPDRPNL